MLGTSILVREGDHIRVSMLEDVFPHIKKYFSIFQTMIMLVFSLFFVWFAFDSLATASKSISVVLKLPMVIIYLMYPLSGIGMLFHTICRLLILALDKNKTGRKEKWE
jgi:TRAP-type C4-dicarboxylate transport system permease small subunit